MSFREILSSQSVYQASEKQIKDFRVICSSSLLNPISATEYAAKKKKQVVNLFDLLKVQLYCLDL